MSTNKRCLGCMQEFEDHFEICPHCGYTQDKAPKEPYHLAPGSHLKKRYLIGRVLGYGGFGVTYIGWDPLLERTIAVKEYLPSEFATRMPDQAGITIYPGEKNIQFDTGLAKFVEEAQRLAKCSTVPGVVRIHDSFYENNTAYIIMEYLEGQTLKQRLDRETILPVPEAQKIILQVLYTLVAVHKKDLIHRDISPENIYLCSDGQIKLVDFGAARYAATDFSKSLSVILKPGYAPEEQYRSHGKQGPWSDVYAVAATMYRMITGSTPADAMERVAKDSLKEPSKLNNQIPQNISNAIMNAMHVHKDDRTATPQAFILALTDPHTPRTYPSDKKKDNGSWPLWLKIALPVMVLCVLTVSLGLVFMNNRSDQDGRTYVPELINLDAEEAEALLKEHALLLLIADKQPSDKVPENRIMQQTPAAGGLILQDGEVSVVISSGAATANMPNLIGAEQTEAKQHLEALGFTVLFEYTTSPVREGHICAQSVSAYETIKLSTIITLTVSQGMEVDDEIHVIVPQLVGLSQAKAIEQLSECKLVYVKIAEQRSNRPAGEILSQSINPGEEVSQGTEIHVIISSGNTSVMPDMQYRSESEATLTLESLSLIVHTQYIAHNTISSGLVISQSIAAGEAVASGTSVTLVISTGRTTGTGSSSSGTTGGIGAGGGGTSQVATPSPTPRPSWGAWTTDASLAGNSTYETETATEYRYSQAEYTESSSEALTGWEQYDQTVVYGEYGDWSSWSPEYISDTDTREVESKFFIYQASYTRSIYYHYKWWDADTYSWKYSYGTAEGGTYHEKSTDEGSFSYSHKYNGYTAYNCSTSPGDEYWYFKESETVPEISGMQYRYREKMKTITYYYKRWGNWSAWSVTPVGSSSDRRIETRTVYRYRLK